MRHWASYPRTAFLLVGFGWLRRISSPLLSWTLLGWSLTAGCLLGLLAVQWGESTRAGIRLPARLALAAASLGFGWWAAAASRPLLAGLSAGLLAYAACAASEPRVKVNTHWWALLVPAMLLTGLFTGGGYGHGEALGVLGRPDLAIGYRQANFLSSAYQYQLYRRRGPFWWPQTTTFAYESGPGSKVRPLTLLTAAWPDLPSTLQVEQRTFTRIDP